MIVGLNINKIDELRLSGVYKVEHILVIPRALVLYVYSRQSTLAHGITILSGKALMPTVKLRCSSGVSRPAGSAGLTADKVKSKIYIKIKFK